jgi:hypothetical protein
LESSEIVVSLRRYKELNREKYRIEKLGFSVRPLGARWVPIDLDVVVELSEHYLFNLIGIKQNL